MHDTAEHLSQEAIDARQNLSGVKRVIGVHSGKGGVGKTFIAVNLALILAKTGKKVGLLDADIDCPNVIRFLNLRDLALNGTKEGRITPLEYKGMHIVSAHLLAEEPSKPMIVRGPIKHKVLTELMTNVDWGTLDALIIDLPPGTSDVPMSGMQLRMDGVIIVTTPQKEAVMDARKSAIMARELHIPVLGIIENMSGDIFGKWAGERLATELDVPYLGSIPLAKEIRDANDNGKAALIDDLAQPALIAAALGEPIATVALKKGRTWWGLKRQ